MIKTILRKYSFALLIALAIAFLAIIVTSYAWGTGYLVIVFDQANANQVDNVQIPQFNLNDASKLDYRGIPTTPITN